MQEKYRHLSEFAEYVGHDFPAEELDIGTAKAFIAHIQKEKGNKSANRRLGDLKACWNWHKHALQRATTTDIYLRSLSSSISHVAQFIEEDVLTKSNDAE